MSEWKPIETAPKDGTAILIFGGSYECENYGGSLTVIAIAEWDDHYKHFGYHDTYFKPEFWMELPEPPK